MIFTVVEEMNPQEPSSWQDAAQYTVSSIFYPVDKLLDSLSDSTEAVLDGLEMIDIQFEGMLNNSKWFESDQMYWAEEWKNLGSIAAAAGIKTGFLDWAFPPGTHPEMKNSASANIEVFDTWMLQEQMTETLIKKQRDYGHHNIARFGRHGILVRCHDKVARLKNLHLNHYGTAVNEGIMDTYVDIIGYSAIGMMWEREWFLLEMKPLDEEHY